MIHSPQEFMIDTSYLSLKYFFKPIAEFKVELIVPIFARHGDQ